MDNFRMPNSNNSQLEPLALDFKKAGKSFSSTKMKATQRYIRELLKEDAQKIKAPTKPASANKLFSDIKGMLQDF